MEPPFKKGPSTHGEGALSWRPLAREFFPNNCKTVTGGGPSLDMSLRSGAPLWRSPQSSLLAWPKLCQSCLKSEAFSTRLSFFPFSFHRCQACALVCRLFLPTPALALLSFMGIMFSIFFHFLLSLDVCFQQNTSDTVGFLSLSNRRI